MSRTNSSSSSTSSEVRSPVPNQATTSQTPNQAAAADQGALDSTPEVTASIDRRSPILRQFASQCANSKLPTLSSLEQILEYNICFGEAHYDSFSKKFIIENMGLFKERGYGTIYMEHLLPEHQTLLNQYCLGTISEMPEDLKTYLNNLDRGWMMIDHSEPGSLTEQQKNYNFTKIVESAARHRIKITALERSHTDYRGVTSGTSRRISLNHNAAEIFRVDNRDNRTDKVIFFVGNTHVNTLEGIPGICQVIPNCQDVLLLDSEEESEELDVRFGEHSLSLNENYADLKSSLTIRRNPANSANIIVDSQQNTQVEAAASSASTSNLSSSASSSDQVGLAVLNTKKSTDATAKQGTGLRLGIASDFSPMLKGKRKQQTKEIASSLDDSQQNTQKEVASSSSSSSSSLEKKPQTVGFGVSLTYSSSEEDEHIRRATEASMKDSAQEKTGKGLKIGIAADSPMVTEKRSKKTKPTASSSKTVSETLVTTTTKQNGK